MKNTVSSRLPDVAVTNHRGEHRKFCSDYVKGRKVLMGFIYCQCGGLCPTTTKHMVRIHEMLRERKLDFQFVSITVTPHQDTVRDLYDYAEIYEAQNWKNWDFIRCAPEDLKSLRFALGAYDPDPAIDNDFRQHSGLLTFGNDKTDRWGALPSGMLPDEIAYTFMRVTRDVGNIKLYLNLQTPSTSNQ